MATLDFPRLDTVPELTLLERQRGDVTVLELEGRLLFGPEADLLRARIRGLVKAGKNKILLGLARVRRVDSVGLGTLIEAAAGARRHSGDVRLFGISERVAAVFSLLGLHSQPGLFLTFPDETQAYHSFRTAPQTGLAPRGM